MGRRKLEIKRIEDKSARQVTFSKRRNGLLKKAKELSVLCDLDIGVVIYSCRGKLYHYSNTRTSLTEILGRYHSSVKKDSSSPEDTEEVQVQGEKSKNSEFMTCGELLKIVEREEELSVDEFVDLEQQLENALIQTRSAKTRSLLESISSLHHKEEMLEQEKRRLLLRAAKIGKEGKGGIDLNVVPDEDEEEEEEEEETQN